VTAVSSPDDPPPFTRENGKEEAGKNDDVLTLPEIHQVMKRSATTLFVVDGRLNQEGEAEEGGRPLLRAIDQLDRSFMADLLNKGRQRRRRRTVTTTTTTAVKNPLSANIGEQQQPSLHHGSCTPTTATVAVEPPPSLSLLHIQLPSMFSPSIFYFIFLN
jgi:hypothetical protein